MASFDLVIRGGKIATASDTFDADIGISDGRIVALGAELEKGKEEIDAAGRCVAARRHRQPLPYRAALRHGHHVRRRLLHAARSRRRSAARPPSSRSRRSIAACRCARWSPTTTSARARKAVIDYAFHLIISDPTEQVLGQELPALIKDGYHLVQGLHDLRSAEARRLPDARRPGVARREGALVMVHAENDDMIRWLAQAPDRARAMARRSSTASRMTRSPRREATHRVDLAVAPARRAGADRPRLEPGGDRTRSAPRRRCGAEDLRRDLPAVSGPHRRRHGPARRRGREVVLQPAAARQGGAGGDLGRACATAPSRSIPPTTRPTGSMKRRRSRTATQTTVQGDGQRRARHRDAPAAAVFRRRAEGAAHHQPVRRAHRDQPRAHLRPVPAQGHDRGRVRRRHRDLESRHREAHRLFDDARRCRLHALRGARLQGLAGDRDQPRAHRRRGRRIESGARLGTIHRARPARAAGRSRHWQHRRTRPQTSQTSSDKTPWPDILKIAAAQLGPLHKADSRAVCSRSAWSICCGKRTAWARSSSSFPNSPSPPSFRAGGWTDQKEVDQRFFEREMPSAETRTPVRRSEEARHRLLHRLRGARPPRARRFNTAILVGPDGAIIGKYRKIHLPGHADHKPEGRVPAPGEEATSRSATWAFASGATWTPSPAC